jgi:hypothetical protein
MTTPTATPVARGPDVLPLPVAGTFLEGLAAQDFARLASTLADSARMTALVPSGIKAWDGPGEIIEIFRLWYGRVHEFELVDANVGEVAARLQLRWRARVRADRLGAGWFVVEQQVYADTGTDGRIERLSMLCSGFRPEISPQLSPEGTPR